MFTLSVLEDEITLHPSKFGTGRHISGIRSNVESRFIDKVIPDVGLVIALYDILSVKDAYIFPGDLKDSQGDACCTVVFRLVVFRPKTNDILLGKILAATPMGLQVSVGFFQDVSIPANQLRKPSKFDERLGTWVWLYQEGNKAAVPYPYTIGDKVAVRVKSVQFTNGGDRETAKRLQVSHESQIQNASADETPSAHHHPKTPAEQPPMLIVGSLEEDGMGLLSWWIG